MRKARSSSLNNLRTAAATSPQMVRTIQPGRWSNAPRQTKTHSGYHHFENLPQQQNNEQVYITCEIHTSTIEYNTQADTTCKILPQSATPLELVERSVD